MNQQKFAFDFGILSRVFAVFSAIFALNGCATSLALGDAASGSAPQLRSIGTPDANTPPVYQWDRPNAFAKIKLEQKLAGDAACLLARSDLMAIGYHPQAKAVDGKPMQGGGYLCGKKPQGDKPDDLAPQLVTVRGVLGWDRPSAFGRVPDEAKIRGNRICQQIGPNLVAAGFHPKALNEYGAIIPDGGFFCGLKSISFQQ